MNETLKRAAELLRQDCLREVGSDEVSQVATKLEALAAQMGESVQEAQHPDDAAADRFAAALKAKLAKARAKGRSGWQDPAWTPAQISQALRQHVEKGDPCDVANYCMFLWARGADIEAAQEAQPVAIVTECEACFTPDVCQLRGTCDHYSAQQLRIAKTHISELEISYQSSIKSLRRDLRSQAKIICEISRLSQVRIAELEAQVENQIESVRFHRQRVDDLAAAYSKLEAERDRWIALYRRAVNEANGLTNYVEDRPELRRAEKALTVIQAEARAALGRES